MYHRFKEGVRISGVWDTCGEEDLSFATKVGMLGGVVGPAVLYGSEKWVLNARKRKRV